MYLRGESFALAVHALLARADREVSVPCHLGVYCARYY